MAKCVGVPPTSPPVLNPRCSAREPKGLHSYQPPPPPFRNAGFCLRALIELLDTYSRDGFVEETFATADSVCAFYAKQQGLTVPSEVWEL